MKLIPAALLFTFLLLVTLGFSSEEAPVVIKMKVFGPDPSANFLEQHEIDVASTAITNPQVLLDTMFKKYIQDGVRIKIIGVHNHTAFVVFEGEEELITKQSGTTGAYFIKAQIVCNLVKFAGIDAVYFIVEEGDHFEGGYCDIGGYYYKNGDPLDSELYRQMLERRITNSFPYCNEGDLSALSVYGDQDSLNLLENLSQNDTALKARKVYSNDEFRKLLRNSISAIKEKIK